MSEDETGSENGTESEYGTESDDCEWSDDDTGRNDFFNGDEVFRFLTEDSTVSFYLFQDGQDIYCYIGDETGVYSIIQGEPYIYHAFEGNQLVENMNSLADTKEKIEIVHAYKHKLSEWQLTSFFLSITCLLYLKLEIGGGQ